MKTHLLNFGGIRLWEGIEGNLVILEIVQWSWQCELNGATKSTMIQTIGNTTSWSIRGHKSTLTDVSKDPIGNEEWMRIDKARNENPSVLDQNGKQEICILDESKLKNGKFKILQNTNTNNTYTRKHRGKEEKQIKIVMHQAVQMVSILD